jgi:hypothetical protein
MKLNEKHASKTMGTKLQAEELEDVIAPGLRINHNEIFVDGHMDRAAYQRRTLTLRTLTMCLGTMLGLLCGSLNAASLVMEPTINHVAGIGSADNTIPLYDPTYIVDGVPYALANEPGEIFMYVAGDPPEELFQTTSVWNNTNYNMTGLTLRIVGSAREAENPGSIVRGPVNAVWGDVNGDGKIGDSDIFSTITVSADGKVIRFENGVIPVDGRFSDVHLATSDAAPLFAGVDASFSGTFVPEPYTFILTGSSLGALLLSRLLRRHKQEAPKGR